MLYASGRDTSNILTSLSSFSDKQLFKLGRRAIARRVGRLRSLHFRGNLELTAFPAIEISFEFFCEHSYTESF